VRVRVDNKGEKMPPLINPTIGGNPLLPPEKLKHKDKKTKNKRQKIKDYWWGNHPPVDSRLKVSGMTEKKGVSFLNVFIRNPKHLKTRICGFPIEGFGNDETIGG